ncbi:MAG: hypothetical protein WBP40_05450 [Candidatus Moraniibacteriota bacterium]
MEESAMSTNTAFTPDQLKRLTLSDVLGGIVPEKFQKGLDPRIIDDFLEALGSVDLRTVDRNAFRRDLGLREKFSAARVVFTETIPEITEPMDPNEDFRRQDMVCSSDFSRHVLPRLQTILSAPAISLEYCRIPEVALLNEDGVDELNRKHRTSWHVIPALMSMYQRNEARGLSLDDPNIFLIEGVERLILVRWSGIIEKWTLRTFPADSDEALSCYGMYCRVYSEDNASSESGHD